MSDIGEELAGMFGCLIGAFFYIVVPIVVIIAAFKIVFGD